MSATEAGQVITEFIRLFNAGDLDGLLKAVYEDDVVFVPAPDGRTAPGTAAIREVLQGFLALGGKMNLVATATFQKGDIALTQNRWRLDVPGKEAIVGSTAEIARRQADGTWKYAIDNPWGAAVLDQAK